MSPVSPQEPPGWTLVLPQAPLPASLFHKEAICYSKLGGGGPCSVKNSYRLHSVTFKTRPALSSILQTGTVSPQRQGNLFQAKC